MILQSSPWRTAQRLAEVEVAVVTELHDADEPAEAGSVDPGGDAVRQPSSQRGGGGIELALNARRPRRHVVGGDGLGRHLGPRCAGGGERPVQRRGDPAQSRERAERGVAGREAIEQELPAVPRVRHQLLRDRHRPHALGVVVLEAAAQARRVAEIGALGEEPRDLDAPG